MPSCMGTYKPYAGALRRCALLSFFAIASGAASAAELTPQPLTSAVRETFQLAPFYQKHLDVGGLPIVGSAKVSDTAIAECAWIVHHMLDHRPDILKALAAAKVRFVVMAYSEYTTDVPEHSHLKPRVYWDRRARGLGATPSAPAVSGGEENLLAFPGDPYPRENISIHEFAHAIHEVGLRTVDPSFDGRLRQTYESAMAAGLWKQTYAAVNRQEYWAEAVQAWFDNNDANNALHNDINTRAKLKSYDPQVATLCAEVFGDGAWRYQKPAARAAEDRTHLASFDPEKAPHFRWREEGVPDQPRVTLQYAGGEMELELGGSREQISRLLAQVHQGYYSGGRARFNEGRLELTPAAKTPDGAPIPGEDGKWTIRLGEPAPEAITAKLLKGAAVLSRAAADSNGVHVQRITRLN
jgi:hypothetical protein